MQKHVDRQVKYLVMKLYVVNRGPEYPPDDISHKSWENAARMLDCADLDKFKSYQMEKAERGGVQGDRDCHLSVFHWAVTVGG